MRELHSRGTGGERRTARAFEHRLQRRRADTGRWSWVGHVRKDRASRVKNLHSLNLRTARELRNRVSFPLEDLSELG